MICSRLAPGGTVISGTVVVVAGGAVVVGAAVVVGGSVVVVVGASVVVVVDVVVLVELDVVVSGSVVVVVDSVEDGGTEVEVVVTTGSVSSVVSSSSPEVHRSRAMRATMRAATPAISAATGPGWRYHGSGSAP